MRFSARTLLVCCAVFALFAGPAAGMGATSGDYDYMKRFSKAFDLIRRDYVRDVANDELMNGAINGMLQSLDPHSNFLSKEDYKEMQQTTSGKFFGVGIELSTENNQLLVVSPIEDTPAYKAGIKAGDIILAVDGQPTQEMSPQEAISKIRGEKGTEVELLILHKEAKAPTAVKIVRDAIPLISVKARFLDNEGYLWVRLTRFSERTTEELRQALKDVAQKTEVKGIVLDLRNNPGGLLDQSVSVADVFLSKGDIVSMRGRNNATMKNYRASEQKDDVQVPVVVLINSGSASASEIVAGALQDHNRAVILGERSFGKGSVQNVIPLEDGTAIKLTIALFFTPSGRSIQAEGIEPDILVPFETPRDDEAKPYLFTREKDYSRHLENGNGGDARENEPAPELVEKETLEILEKDNQLRLGLQMVRGLPKISKVHSR